MQSCYRAKVTSKGQLTVPREVRRALGINPGDEVAFDVGPDGIQIRPVRLTNPFQELQGRWRIGTGLTPEEVDAWIRDIRGRDDDEL